MHAVTDDPKETRRDASSQEEGAAGLRGRGIASMEIADYFKLIKKRIWVVVLIPVFAAGLATAIIFSRPTEYSATATVAAPWFISNAPGDAYAAANGASQFVADFVAAIAVPPVVDAVAEATGASEDAIETNVTATPIGESTLIEVGYVTADQREAEPVVHALAIETLRFLFRPSAVATVDEEPADGSTLPVERLELLLAQPETVSVTPTQIEPRGPDLIRGLQVAIGGGLLLGLLVVILLEILPFDRLRRWAAPHAARLTRRRPEPVAAGPDTVPQDDSAGSPMDVDAPPRAGTVQPLAGTGTTRSGQRPPQETRARRSSRSTAARPVVQGDDGQPSDRPPAGPMIGPIAAQEAAAAPEANKPRATKTRQGNRNKPRRNEPVEATSEAVRRDAAAASETDVVDVDPGMDVIGPRDSDDRARHEDPPKSPRKRRPSRADARRKEATNDERPPGESPPAQTTNGALDDGEPGTDPDADDIRSARPKVAKPRQGNRSKPAGRTSEGRGKPEGKEPAARGNKTNDRHPVDGPADGPEVEPLDADGSVAHSGAEGATRAAEEHRTAEA